LFLIRVFQLEKLFDNINREKDKIVVWKHEYKESQIRLEKDTQTHKNR
jgi:hypothetical protein